MVLVRSDQCASSFFKSYSVFTVALQAKSLTFQLLLDEYTIAEFKPVFPNRAFLTSVAADNCCSKFNLKIKIKIRCYQHLQH